MPTGAVSHAEPPKAINRENKSANDCGEGGTDQSGSSRALVEAAEGNHDKRREESREARSEREIENNCEGRDGCNRERGHELCL